jgi:DNA helicase HerA-like ATPase
VIDLNGLAGAAGLQRFVVATVLRQLINAQTGARAVSGLKYLVVLDELNRFAPRGGRDPITRLVELVAAEMRSQGILLFGAQQQASLVSEKVIENAGLRAIGKTGMLELSHTVWRALSATSKTLADALPPTEKLILQDNFRQPMHVRVPFPAWAMRRAEAGAAIPDATTEGRQRRIRANIDEDED